MTAPRIAQKAPYKADLEAGRTYFWCACGLSASQPFCDGKHKGTDLVPMKIVADVDGPAFLCGCKCTVRKPFCDGSHKGL